MVFGSTSFFSFSVGSVPFMRRISSPISVASASVVSVCPHYTYSLIAVQVNG
jgi:hypothetical protein